MAKNRLIYQTHGLNYSTTILEGSKKGLYTITYGHERREDMTWKEAAETFGKFLFHNLANSGVLDTQED